MVALKLHQTGRRYAFGLFDEAIEGPPQGHQARDLAGMHIRDAARQTAMHDLTPLLDASLLKPRVQGTEVREVGQWLP